MSVSLDQMLPALRFGEKDVPRLVHRLDKVSIVATQAHLEDGVLMLPYRLWHCVYRFSLVCVFWGAAGGGGGD